MNLSNLSQCVRLVLIYTSGALRVTSQVSLQEFHFVDMTEYCELVCVFCGHSRLLLTSLSVVWAKAITACYDFIMDLGILLHKREEGDQTCISRREKVHQSILSTRLISCFFLYTKRCALPVSCIILTSLHTLLSKGIPALCDFIIKVHISYAKDRNVMKWSQLHLMPYCMVMTIHHRS